MKISELISSLSALQEKQGDIDVVREDHEYGYRDISSVTYQDLFYDHETVVVIGD